MEELRVIRKEKSYMVYLDDSGQQLYQVHRSGIFRKKIYIENSEGDIVSTASASFFKRKFKIMDINANNEFTLKFRYFREPIVKEGNTKYLFNKLKKGKIKLTKTGSGSQILDIDTMRIVSKDHIIATSYDYIPISVVSLLVILIIRKKNLL